MRKSWLTAASVLAAAAVEGHAARAQLFSAPVSVPFGDVRVGTSSSQDFNVTVLQTIDSGEIDPATAPFSGGPVSLATSGKGSVPATYSFTPSASGPASESVGITAINLSAKIEQTGTIALSGTGVGPLYQSSTIAPGGTIDFGNIVQGVPGTEDLEITNASTDPGAASLTELTLLSAELTGGADFSLATFSPDTVLDEGDMFDLGIDFQSSTLGPETADLAITTDQDAVVGQPGDVFDYTLTADVVPAPSTSVPEPGSTALLASGLAGLAAVLRRRRPPDR